MILYTFSYNFLVLVIYNRKRSSVIGTAVNFSFQNERQRARFPSSSFVRALVLFEKKVITAGAITTSLIWTAFGAHAYFLSLKRSLMDWANGLSLSFLWFAQSLDLF